MMAAVIKFPMLWSLNFPFHHPLERDFFIFAKKMSNDQNIHHTCPFPFNCFGCLWAFTGGYGQGKV